MLNRLLLIFLLLAGGSAVAQLNLNPYSRIGIGEVFQGSSARNFSMGGIGIATSDATTINSLNPASYADIKFTTLDFSWLGSYYQNETALRKNSVLTGTVYNASLAFRTNKKLTFVAGLLPYSGTNYNIVIPDSLHIDTTTIHYNTKYSATGGLNTVFLGVGFPVLRKIRVGLNIPFAFGSSNYNWFSTYPDNAGIFPSTVKKRVNLVGFIPRAGIQYEDTVKYQKTIDHVKVNQKEISAHLSVNKELDKELRKIAGKVKNTELQEVTNERKKAKIDQKKVIILTKKNALTEAGNSKEKDIEKLDNKVRTFNNKKRKLDLKITTAQKKLADKKRVIEKHKERNVADTEKLKKENTELENDPSRRYEKTKAKILIRVGGVFDPPSVLTGSKLVEYNNFFVNDTLSNIKNGKVTLPYRAGGGFSVSDSARKWTIGGDFTFQNWKQLQYFNESYSLRASWIANFGGEYVHDIQSSKYLARVAWRAGAWYENSMLVRNNLPINQAGFVVGVGLPLALPLDRRFRMNSGTEYYSRLNIGIAFGQQGTIEGGLLKQTFIQLRIGVNLNDRWFIKRVLD